jgi:serine/threonine protein phosphatase PrpC
MLRERGQLQIAVGFATTAGRRPQNQDFGAVDLGSAQEQALQGIVAVVADGAGEAGGRVAAELAVRAFLDGYRSQSVLAGVGPAAMIALDGFNRWLHGQAHAAPALRGAATTFTAAVLRGRSATLLHVGDSRAWRLRSGKLALLTDDHVALQADGGQRLLRAVGLEPALRLDVTSLRLETHDRFLLSTDGLHATLPRRALVDVLGRRQAPQADAEALVAAALAAGGHDNATAVVIDVIEVPAPDYSMIVAEMAALPVLPPPAVGDVVDGFEILGQIADSPTNTLFLSRDRLAEDRRALAALKFPKCGQAAEADRDRFMREVFVGQRIIHPFIGGSASLADGRQSQLYVAMPYHAGETLEARLQRGPMRIDEAISVASKVGRGLSALHRAGVIHRDLKPQNIILPDDGGVKIIDLGVARLPKLEELEEAETPGTADFMAPELFEGAPGDPLSDQYALGVVMYRMLTAQYPFGETPPGARPLFGPVPPVSRHRGDVPAWLNATIMRAISLRQDDRFGDVDELVFQLEAGQTRAAPVSRPRPLIERNPLVFWRLLCAVLAILLAISLWTR